MPSGVQKFVRQQIQARQPPTTANGTAVVTAISSGVVTVTHDGSSNRYPHLASYTPTAGDVVAVIPWNGTYLILGKPTGFPT